MSTGLRFGVWTLTCLVIANMIGFGVFTTSGFSLESLRSPRLVVLAWIVGGMVALAGAVSYGRLARIMPESGGEYLFLSKAAHPVLGFLAGWISLIAGFTGAIAGAAVAFEAYAMPDEVRPEWIPSGCVAVGIVLLCGLFHSLLPYFASGMQNAAVFLKLLLIGGFLLFAISQVGIERWHGEPLPTEAQTPWSTLLAFAGALVWISLSYSGFNAAVYVAGEAYEPQQTVPEALLRGTIIVTAVYIMLNAIFVYATPASLVADQADIASVVAGWLGGPVAANVVRTIIAVALFTSVSSMVMAAPRVYARMADDGVLPAVLRIGTEAPRAAIWLQVATAIVIILASDLRGLLSYLGLTLSLSAACSVACLFLPKVRQGPLVHVNSVAPLLYITATVISAVLMAIDEPGRLTGFVVTVASGLILWWAMRGNSSSVTSAES